MRSTPTGRYAAIAIAVGLLAIGEACGAQAGKSPIKVFIVDYGRNSR